MKYFSIVWPMKDDVRFEYVHEKMSDFVSFTMFGLTVVIKLRNFDFGSHWNTLIFFHKKDMLSDLNMFHKIMSDFVPFLLFRFTLIIELINFDFERHSNTLMFFKKKKMWCQIWICPTEKCLILFHSRF